MNNREWLHLSENTTGPRYFVNVSGEIIQFFGMARAQCCAQSCEDGPYGGAAGVARHFKNLGCNVIRLAVDITDLSKEKGIADEILLRGGYNEAGINRFIDEKVDPDLQAIMNEGMYVILDLHEYPPQGADEVAYAREHYIPIWRELAKRYKDEPRIAVFELWNEPYPADIALVQKNDAAWVKSIREYFIDAVEDLRRIDQKHVIMVSDYNAGWGMAWDTCWKDYRRLVDPVYRNTCYSIHLCNIQLENEAPHYADWLVRRAEECNACFVFGEIETEPGIATTVGMENLVKLLRESADTHHFAAVLWRPHDDTSNYVPVWTDFAREYTAR